MADRLSWKEKKMMKVKKCVALILSVLSIAAMLSGCTSTSPQSNVTNLPSTQVPLAAAPNLAAASQAPALSPKERWGIDEFVIVLLPGEDSPETAYTRNLFDTALGEVLGIPVKEYHGNNYSACVEAMRTGHAHAASLGPFAYVHAVERAGAECFAVTSVDGSHGYYSQIITHVDSDIYTLDDLKGRVFGFVDPESTSGNIVPSNELLNYFEKTIPDITFNDLHINGRFFESVMFTGNHANSCQGVFRKDVEAAAVSSSTLASQIRNGHVEEDKIRIIHTSPLIPASPLSIKGDLPQDLKDLVISFFLEWGDEEFWSIRAASSQGASRYWPVYDHEYDYVRELRDKFDLTD